MPLFPTLNDLKAVTSSINPLNLFTDSPRSASFSDHSPSGSSAEAGPGPSSTSSRLQQAQQRDALGSDGTKPIRPSLKNSTSSESDSFDHGGRRISGGGHSVVIHEEERPKRDREKKKKVNIDVSDCY